jgi:sortase A
MRNDPRPAGKVGLYSKRQFVARLCTALGVLGLAFVGIAYLDSAVQSHAAIAAFQQALAETPSSPEFSPGAIAPDQSLWSDSAKTRYEKVRDAKGVPLALLRIGRLNLVAPVFLGTDPITLNRGVGVIDGTARPGEAGNIGLSGHRDSFFRPLKDIVVGDSIELQTLNGVQRFQVSEMRVVDPLDVSVIKPTGTTVLTLITCYPFYFVGSAPDRYVVRATLVEGDAAGTQPQFPAASGAVRKVKEEG